MLLVHHNTQHACLVPTCILTMNIYYESIWINIANSPSVTLVVAQTAAENFFALIAKKTCKFVLASKKAVRNLWYACVENTRANLDMPKDDVLRTHDKSKPRTGRKFAPWKATQQKSNATVCFLFIRFLHRKHSQFPNGIRYSCMTSVANMEWDKKWWNEMKTDEMRWNEWWVQWACHVLSFQLVIRNNGWTSGKNVEVQLCLWCFSQHL